MTKTLLAWIFALLWVLASSGFPFWSFRVIFLTLPYSVGEIKRIQFRVICRYAHFMSRSRAHRSLRRGPLLLVRGRCLAVGGRCRRGRARRRRAADPAARRRRCPRLRHDRRCRSAKCRRTSSCAGARTSFVDRRRSRRSRVLQQAIKQ